jgi:hypothetical protein
MSQTGFVNVTRPIVVLFDNVMPPIVVLFVNVMHTIVLLFDNVMRPIVVLLVSNSCSETVQLQAFSFSPLFLLATLQRI